MSKSKNMASIEDVKQMYIPFEVISLATNEFAPKNLIARGGFGRVYRGESDKHGCIAVKRLDSEYGQGEREFKMEISLLSKYKHENIVTLIGFCDDYDVEMILVYKFESNGSLDRHLKNEGLTWIRRIQICLDAARGLKYLHDYNAFHRDVKSANILLDDKWKAKISDFGLSRVASHSYVFSIPRGTHGYVDPNYINNGILTKKTDVFSFGVMLWEVVCGKLTYDTSFKKRKTSFPEDVKRHYIKGTLWYEMIPLYLRNQISPDSFDAFTKTAYQCLKNDEERPTMEQVVEQLQVALQNQEAVEKPEEEKKAEKEEKPTATGDENKGKKLKDTPPPPPPPPPPHEIVLSVFMHCGECARRVRRCLYKGVEGVEKVFTYCETSKVVVKGENADPLKVLESVKKETRRAVELLSPVPTLSVNKPKKTLQENKKDKSPSMNKHKKTLQENKKDEASPSVNKHKKTLQENKKDEAPPPVTKVVLEVPMKGEAFTIDTMEIKGVETAVSDLNKSHVDVKPELVDCVLEKTDNNDADPRHRKTELVTEIESDDADPSPLEEIQWLLALKIVGFCLFLICIFVSYSLLYLGQRVYGWLLKIYDISNPQTVNPSASPSPSHVSSINEQAPQQSLPEHNMLVK